MYMSGANKKSPWRLNSTESRSHTTFCKNVRGGSGGPTPCMRPLFVRPCLPPYLGDDRRGDDGGDGELCELLPESRFFASISYAFMHMFLIASNRICASSYFSWKKNRVSFIYFNPLRQPQFNCLRNLSPKWSQKYVRISRNFWLGFNGFAETLVPCTFSLSGARGLG